MTPRVLPLAIDALPKLLDLLLRPAHEARKQRHHDGLEPVPEIHRRAPPHLLPLGLARPLVDRPLVRDAHNIDETRRVQHVARALARRQLEPGLGARLDHQVRPALERAVGRERAVVAVQRELDVLDFDPAVGG